MSRLLRAADRVDIAIPYWERMLRPLDPIAGRPYRWLPVGSNVPVTDDPPGVASLRERLTSTGQSTVIGSFGTFASDVATLLGDVLPPLLLGRPDRAGVLLGRGSERVAEAWIRRYPELSGRLTATGPLDQAEISRHLQACDLLVQPFPGGVCSKRTSLMAGLAHGVATVTTSGEVTEPVWAETGAVGLAPEGDAHGLIERSEVLLNDREARTRLAILGLALYNNRFASRHTIASLIVEQTRSTPAETARS
jgi:glycosyltransferase involved in cell wall biosynthesis